MYIHISSICCFSPLCLCKCSGNTKKMRLNGSQADSEVLANVHCTYVCMYVYHVYQAIYSTYICTYWLWQGIQTSIMLDGRRVSALRCHSSVSLEKTHTHTHTHTLTEAHRYTQAYLHNIRIYFYIYSFCIFIHFRTLKLSNTLQANRMTKAKWDVANFYTAVKAKLPYIYYFFKENRYIFIFRISYFSYINYK